MERVRGIAHVDAQAHIPAGRRPRVRGHTGRDCIPVLQDGFGAPRSNLNEARLAHILGTAGSGGGHRRRRTKARGQRIPSPCLGDASARQSERGRGVCLQVRRRVSGLLHRSLHRLPGLRSFLPGNVNRCVRLHVGGGVFVKFQRREARGQDNDARRLTPEGERRHALTEERALRATVRGLALGVKLTVHTAAHDDVTDVPDAARDDAQLADPIPQLKRIHAGIRHALDRGGRRRNNQAGQIRAAAECVLADFLEPSQVGAQIHLGQREVVQERVVRDVGRTAQVHSGKIRRVREGPGTDCLEQIRQGQRGEPRAFKGVIADSAQ